ncbi:PREDICTED: uncharacterized protein LOC109583326 [Amphimedon queenslandica]|uniref:Uncharacterized protein n=1 Tax=Amphimedon queenslandica TaxID=400682 RepID=A0AAN0JBM7_AMPQE|nr:PREDICTED: uncharacterized protein LOC109583326 [Amphimedon queenslandica]|eukprot:XP_019854177.1 PREDICTED: uncharacterized protein LOC109583326 [Amphimedon queenslandica]
MTWRAATCFQFYNISVNEVLVTTANELSYNYTFSNVDTYKFELITVGYLGDIIGVLSETYNWRPFEFTSGLKFNVDENILSFTIQGRRHNQPPINNCSIIVGSDTGSCLGNDTIPFNNVVLSSDTNIRYNITVINDAGISSDINILSGDLERVINVTQTRNNSVFVTKTFATIVTETVPGNYTSPIIGDPVVFAAPFIVLGILIILSICWIVLRICWKRQCCCPRIWRSSFWLIFFCYDCCTYDAEEKEGNTIGLKNPSVGEEKGGDTSL